MTTSRIWFTFKWFNTLNKTKKYFIKKNYLFLHTVVSVYIEYNCVPVIIAVNNENEIASNARNIKNIIVAGGDHDVHAI